MSVNEQSAVKDGDAEHPIASAWRPTFREIVSALVDGDFRLERGIESVEPIPADTANQISDLVLDAKVHETEAGYRFKVDLVYVP